MIKRRYFPLVVWYLTTLVCGWVPPPPPSKNNVQYYLNPIATAMMQSNDDIEVGEEEEEATIINLQTHTNRSSPKDTLTNLAQACTHLDIKTFDVYGDFESDKEQSYLQNFEAEVAQVFGKDDAVFCISGGMAQSIVLAINARRRSGGSVGNNNNNNSSGKRRNVFACHPTSHLLLHENNHYSELLDMEAVIIGDGDGQTTQQRLYDPDALKDEGCYELEPIRLSHVQELFASDSSSILTYPNQIPINCTSKVDEILSTLMIELPHREIGGKLTPWDEVTEISRLCRERGIYYHCDGARIFEASAGYGHTSVKETSQPFDTIYISFYKGLGSISGAMLIGDTTFCAEARIWLRRMGGNLYSVLPYAVSCWDGFRKNCIRYEETENDVASSTNRLVYDKTIFENRQRKLTRIVTLLADDESISTIVKFDPVTPEVNMIHGYMAISYDECLSALEEVKDMTTIQVLNRVRRCDNNMKFGCRFEWTIGEANIMIADEQFVHGWKTFAKVVLNEL